MFILLYQDSNDPELKVLSIISFNYPWLNARIDLLLCTYLILLNNYVHMITLLDYLITNGTGKILIDL